MSVDRRRLLALAASAVPPLLVGRALADSYPTRPVTVLVGFPPGGGADILTRIVCDWLRARLGQPFIVENRPGAATSLATEAVVRAPADGYTLLATTTSNLLNGALFDNLRYDFARDIAPVASLTTQPLVLVVPAGAAATVPAFIARAQANPGKINMGNFGSGTISHLAAELFKQAAGVDFVSVPYRGSPPMLVDLRGGRIDAAFDNIPTAIEHVRSGSLRALAVTTAVRSEALPDVPAMAEFIPGYEAFTLAGIGAPKGTPADTIERLNASINAGLADPQLRARIAGLGATPLTGAPADFSRLIERESERWATVIKSSGVKLN